MTDFNIRRGLSSELFPDGVLNPNILIEDGCWYLCDDTAELFIGVNTENGLTLKTINETKIKQEVTQTVVPAVEEVKTKVETVLVPKIDEELVPAITEVKSTAEELKTLVGSVLGTKADKVLFTTTKFVKNSIGGFVKNEDISGLSLADLFAKLLGLSDDPGETPDAPEQPGGATVDQIIKESIPMYQLSADGVLTALTYDDIIIITAEEDANPVQQKPYKSGFYKILNYEGEAVEFGYQQVQVKIPGMPFMIALPDFVDYQTQVTTEFYREMDSSWQITNLPLTKDPVEIADICDIEGCEIPEVPQGYFLWASANMMSSNTVYRFIIKEVEEV